MINDSAQTVDVSSPLPANDVTILAQSFARIIHALRTTEGDARRRIVSSISRIGREAGLDVDTAEQLAHLLNMRAQAAAA